jgi:uncharacterized protein (TIGR02246 family)
MEGMMPGTGQQAVQTDTSLDTTLKRFNEAFNRADPNEVATFWAEDGTLLSPGGEFGRGRAGVAKVYGHDCDTILDATTSKFTIVGARKIADDCVFLDLDHDIQNFKMPNGTTGTMKIHVVILAQRKGSAWQWLDARPYAFVPPPGQTH